MPDFVLQIALVLILSSSVISTVIHNWKLTLIALAIQYLAMSIIISTSVPISVVVIKLLVGWMCCSVLGISCFSIKFKDGHGGKTIFSSIMFRILVVALVATIVGFTITNVGLAFSVSVPSATLLAASFLILIGLVQLALTMEPLYLITGLLTAFWGFESFYSILEVSSLVVGLLAIVNMGLVLVGSYLLIKEKADNNP